MSASPGAMGLLWLWAAADVGPAANRSTQRGHRLGRLVPLGHTRRAGRVKTAMIIAP